MASIRMEITNEFILSNKFYIIPTAWYKTIWYLMQTTIINLLPIVLSITISTNGGQGVSHAQDIWTNYNTSMVPTAPLLLCQLSHNSKVVARYHFMVFTAFNDTVGDVMVTESHPGLQNIWTHVLVRFGHGCYNKTYRCFIPVIRAS